MEVVHILGDEELQLTQILKLDNRSMPSVRFDRSGRSGYGWKPFLLPCPDAIRSPKVRYPRLGTDARPGENDEIFGLEHPLG
jgi:hypothetical protein